MKEIYGVAKSAYTRAMIAYFTSYEDALKISAREHEYDITKGEAEPQDFVFTEYLFEGGKNVD